MSRSDGAARRSRRSSPAIGISDYLLLAAVLLLPWAFGGIEIWAHRLAQLLIVAAAAIHFVRERDSSSASSPLNRLRIILVPAVLLALLGAIQVIPLPMSVIRSLSPKAHDIYQESHTGGGTVTLDRIVEDSLTLVPEVKGLEEPPVADPPFAAASISASRSPTLSISPRVSTERLYWYLSLLLAFCLIQLRGREPARYRYYRNALIVNFLLLAIFGLIFAATGSDRLYWIRNTAQPARPFGPYVNPTNFAAVMELATPWIAATALAARRRSGRRDLPAPILIAAAIICLLAGLMAASKAAAILLGVALFWLLVRYQKGVRQRLLTIGAAVLVAVVSLPLLALTPLGGRMTQFIRTTGGSFSEVERIVGWKATLPMIADFPLFGVGAGAFSELFPIYAPAGGWSRLSHVHNDYLEVLVELGWPGLILVVWMLVAFLFLAVRNSAGSFSRYGLLLGLICLVAHAAVDFNHQIPANALLFVVLSSLLLLPRRGRSRS